MIDENVQHLLREADTLLISAEEEMSRPSGDVHSFFICNHIKLSITKYLQAFVQAYGLHPPLHPTPDNLYRMCLSIDPRFSQLDFSPLACSHEKSNNNYCLEIAHLQECLDLAETTKTLVFDQISFK